jgi:hypothetical protein
MSGYYDYYGYGDDTTDAGADSAPIDVAPATDYYEEAAPVEAEETSEASKVCVWFAIVPVMDLATYYVTNNKWSGESNAAWTSVADMSMYLGVAKLAMFGAAMGVPAVGNMFMAVAGFSAVTELYIAYLINTANSTVSDTSSTKIAVATTSVAFLVSVAAAMPMPADAEEEDYYYEDAAPADEEEAAPADDAPVDDAPADDAYGGYGYYY